jgi:hypothetical protein
MRLARSGSPAEGSSPSHTKLRPLTQISENDKLFRTRVRLDFQRRALFRAILQRYTVFCLSMLSNSSSGAEGKLCNCSFAIHPDIGEYEGIRSTQPPQECSFAGTRHTCSTIEQKKACGSGIFCQRVPWELSYP